MNHAGRPNWQNCLDLPPGVRYHDYALRRHESPFFNEGHTGSRDAYSGRMDKLWRQRVRAAAQVAHENDALGNDDEYDDYHPVYVQSERVFARFRNLSARHIRPPVQRQHVRQLEIVLSQLVSGHDWGGAADVLALLCAEYRELPFTAFQASIGVFTRHQQDALQQLNSSQQHSPNNISSQSQLDAPYSQLPVDNNLVRFLRGCLTRHVPYRHLALRELADHFMHYHEFVSSQNVLRQYIMEFPFSGDPEVHGRLGICLVELLFRDYEKQGLYASKRHRRQSSRLRSSAEEAHARTRNQRASEAWTYLRTSLTMQPTRYTELAYCVDLFLGAGDLNAARHILEDFCRVNPRMHAPHSALAHFLAYFEPGDHTARLFVAARALAIDHSDDDAASECIELYRRAFAGQWQIGISIPQMRGGLVPLFANYVESVESVDNWNNVALCGTSEEYEMRGARLQRAWEYLAELCDTSISNVHKMEGMLEIEDDHDNARETVWESNTHAAWASIGGGLLLPAAAGSNFRPYWFDPMSSGNADRIATLPPGWKIEYQIVEGLLLRKSSKTDPSHRIQSYINHSVVDPETGVSYNSLDHAMDAVNKLVDPLSAVAVIGNVPLHKRRDWWQSVFFGSDWMGPSPSYLGPDDSKVAYMAALAKSVTYAKSRIKDSTWFGPGNSELSEL